MTSKHSFITRSGGILTGANYRWITQSYMHGSTMNNTFLERDKLVSKVRAQTVLAVCLGLKISIQ